MRGLLLKRTRVLRAALALVVVVAVAAVFGFGWAFKAHHRDRRRSRFPGCDRDSGCTGSRS